MAERSGGGPPQPSGDLDDALGEPKVDQAGDGGEHRRGRRQRQRQDFDQAAQIRPRRRRRAGIGGCAILELRSVRSRPLRTVARKRSSSVPT